MTTNLFYFTYEIQEIEQVDHKHQNVYLQSKKSKVLDPKSNQITKRRSQKNWNPLKFN